MMLLLKHLYLFFSADQWMAELSEKDKAELYKAFHYNKTEQPKTTNVSYLCLCHFRRMEWKQFTRVSCKL